MADLNQGTRWKGEFLKRILQIDKHEKKEDHYNVMTKESYDKLMDEIEEAQLAEKKTQKQYRRLNRFKVINVCGTRKLVTKKEPMKYYLYVDEIFDIIEAAHVAVGHRGRDRLRNETSRIYANITIEMINIFLSMCETCQLKKSVKKKGTVSKPVLHSDTNSRCRVDLIDMQMREDRGFKFIMVYQDHLTKFVLLRALRSERAVEVADQLLDIFLTFGAPCILYSDNDSEFVNSVIDDLASFWPECKLVRGKPRHSEGSIEWAKRDVEKLLASWMHDNNTTNWSNGLRFVQFMKNRTLHSGIKQSPYKAMFGTEPRVGLTTSSLPLDVIKAMRDEDDIKEALNKINTINKEKKADILDFSKEVFIDINSSPKVYEIDNVTKMIKTEPADKMDLPGNLHPCEFIQLKEEPVFKEEYIEIKVSPDEVHSDFEVVHEIDNIAKVIKDEPVSSDEVDSENNSDANKYTPSNNESSCEKKELQMTPSHQSSGLGKRRKTVTKQNARKKPCIGKDQATTRPNSTADKSKISPTNKKCRGTCTCPNCAQGDMDNGSRRKQHICHVTGCNKVFGKTSHLKAHLH